jgi:uncharacterized protein DUF2604
LLDVIVAQERILMSKTDPNITVTIVVSGQPTSLKVNIHQKVEELVREALRQSGNQGQPPGDWELRTTDGNLIEQTARIGDAGIIEGITLFLSPRAGIGGDI